MGRRAVVIVLDGLGAGDAPDAAVFGDEGANTLANTAKAVGGLRTPNLQALGLGNVEEIEGVPPAQAPAASYGLMVELSAAKATLAGHWEMMGLVLEDALPTYPDGFPREIVSRFERETGRSVIGNKPASGTQIIEELGPEHETNRILDPLHLRRLRLPGRRQYRRYSPGRTLRGLQEGPPDAYRGG